MKSFVLNTIYDNCIDSLSCKILFGIIISFVWKDFSLVTDVKLPNSVLFGENVAINFIAESWKNRIGLLKFLLFLRAAITRSCVGWTCILHDPSKPTLSERFLVQASTKWLFQLVNSWHYKPSRWKTTHGSSFGVMKYKTPVFGMYIVFTYCSFRFRWIKFQHWFSTRYKFE
jgi:hypothetical protein